jgi:H+-transporting ATPase
MKRHGLSVDGPEGWRNVERAMDGKSKGLEAPGTAAALSAFHANGLSSEEAKARILAYGYNEIPEKKENRLKAFLSRYWGPMPWLLEAAMLLSFLLKRPIEAAMIFAVLTVNAVIGYRHSADSRKAIDLLKSKLAATFRVLRDGAWVTMLSREAVPDDVITVKLGEIVPADGCVISGRLSVDQSSITGESYPVELGPGDTVFSGSPVRAGEARCLVKQTGANSFFGKTARLVESAKHASHQEEVMMKIVRYMMYLGLAASLLVAGYALILHIDPWEIVSFAVIFLMGAVPVALPAVLTIVQSVGALELSKRGAVVSRLESIEDAASIDTLCLDKTGTITKNKIEVSDAWMAPGTERPYLILLALLSSSEEGGEPIDAAMRKAAEDSGISAENYVRIDFKPFDPLDKRTESVVEKDGLRIRIAKGAPLSIIRLCAENEGDEDPAALEAVSTFSRQGYRSIAVVAGTADGSPLRLAGVVALSDPLREDSARMIGEMRALGIRPVMLTGDDAAIGARVAAEVGIGDRILGADTFANLGDAELAELIAGCDGAAGVYPEDKFRIVRALQSEGRLVGMTGDGINDAPALKQAEMGIAVYGAADVAKSAAGIVLTEPGLAVIVHAVETSRLIYQRMLSWVFNKIIKVISFVVLLTASFFWFKEIPLTMLGMALLVFANDFATMSLASDKVRSAPNPNRWKVGTITLASIIPGLIFALQGLGALALGRYAFRLGMPELKTLLLLNLIFSSQFRVLIVRERGWFWKSMPSMKLAGTSAAMIAIFGLMGWLGLLTSPLPLSLVLTTLGYSAIASFAADFPKVLSFRILGIEDPARP